MADRVHPSLGIPLERSTLMQKPEVGDALMRIHEGLDDDAQDHTKSIARHSLLCLTQYITALERTIDFLDDNKYEDHQPPPWEIFEQQLEEITS